MKRRERRQRQNAREMERRKREKQGLRGHYISMNGMEIPSGFGVGAWQQELNKLCTALDPSILDIHHQSEEAMSTLRRRLKDNFEYSAPVDRAYIRQLAGKSVTQRRAKLLLSLKCGGKCSAGFDEDIWRRLDRISKDPHREELSQRMKYANACRINKGRTGPKGEEGVREDLYQRLGREPDPDELEYELRRNKGYDNYLKKKNVVWPRTRSPSFETNSDRCGEENIGEEGNVRNKRGDGKSSFPEDGRGSQKMGRTDIRQMEEELENLQAALRAA